MRRRRPRPRALSSIPAWVRVTHWINAVAVVVMILLRLGNLQRLAAVSLRVPARDHARRLARRRAALAFRGHVAAGRQRPRLSGARARHRPLPAQAPSRSARARSWPTPRRRSRGQLAHDDLSVYNAVQKLLYLGVILAGIVIVLSGLAIWKPVQLQELTALFGGYDAARYVHFFAMAAIVGFLVDPRGDGVRGAEEPARHDHRPLRRAHMPRIRKAHPRRRSRSS